MGRTNEGLPSPTSRYHLPLLYLQALGISALMRFHQSIQSEAGVKRTVTRKQVAVLSCPRDYHGTIERSLTDELCYQKLTTGSDICSGCRRIPPESSGSHPAKAICQSKFHPQLTGCEGPSAV